MTAPSAKETTFQTSSIYVGITKCDPRVVRECVKRGERLDLRCEETGTGYLHLVMQCATPMTETSFIPIVYALSNENVDLDYRDCEGVTALQAAIRCNLLSLMEAMLKCGANPDPTDVDLIKRHTSYFQDEFLDRFRKFHPGYWDAVADNKRFRVNILVKSWCRINISRNGQSLIEYAKRVGCDKGIVDILQNHEASVEFAHALIAGDRERMELLLHYNSLDLDSQDWTHRENYSAPYVPLGFKDVARIYNHSHVLHLLDRPPGFRSSLTSEHSSSVTSAVCAIM